MACFHLINSAGQILIVPVLKAGTGPQQGHVEVQRSRINPCDSDAFIANSSMYAILFKESQIFDADK